jgi:hypothetical protein
MLNPQVVQRGLLDDRRIIMPEDIENTVLVPHKGDISGTDVTLTNIGGFELPVPVTSRGGARYPNSPLTPEGNYWASMKTGAVPFQNKAEGLMESLKMDATGVYTAMGREANYFNQAFADGMLQWAQSMKLPKEAIKKFDDDLRKSKPDWVGLNSPEARDQLLGMGNFKPEGAGKFRSAFTKTMSKSAYRDLGFPTIVDIEKAFIDPDLAGTALGEAGFTMGRVGKGFDLNRNTNHPSYNTGIGGEYIGGFEQSVPPQIMYPDAYKQLEGVMTKPKSDKPPRLLYDAEKIDAIAKRQDLFQVADARWVDTASKWLEDNKGASNAALIAAVGLPATMATQEAEAAPTGLLRNVFPAPQRMFDPADKAYKPFLESFGQTPGGRYLEMGPEGPKDITGEYPASAALGVGPDGKPKFQVAPEQATNIPEPKGPGRKIKTNLAKKKTGWKWTQAPEGYDPNPDGGFPIVSVNDGKDHYYTLNTDFPEGVELARYPNEASEPRLKPTRKGHVNLGQKVGEIEMRGKKHPVYDNITIRQAAPVAMTGLLGAGMSEDSDASILGSLSKLGAGRQDLLGMAQKMANEGMDVQSIRERTGWEIGADGQWRTELPNTNTKINIPEVAEGSQYYSGTIADVIDDPELLSQYEKGGRKPTVRDMEGEIEEYGSRGFFGSLGDIAFTVDKNMPEGQGFHREGYFDEFGERQPETIVISGKSSPAEQRATLLHELQHSIQDREGFAAGGNQKQFAEEERIKDSFYERVGLTPAGSGRLQELEQKISDVGQRSMSLQEMNDLERLRVEKQISDRFNADTVGEAGARSPYGMYKGLMGEVEARNVETRDKMKPDFLRATPLELSEDVFEPRSQQIFRAGSDDELFRELEYLKYPDVRSNAPEYREAPVVQEQSFGDMVNEYANINQRAQAAEAQKFGLLMREDARLRDMGSAAFGQVSPELAAYRRSQILPTIGEMGMGALEGAVDTVDFVSQLPTAISTMTMPKRTPLRDRLGGLLDYSFVDERDQRARDEARLIGGLLSPI